ARRRFSHGRDERAAGTGQAVLPAARGRTALLRDAEDAELPLARAAPRRPAPRRQRDQRQQLGQRAQPEQEPGLSRQLLAAVRVGDAEELGDRGSRRPESATALVLPLAA